MPSFVFEEDSIHSLVAAGQKDALLRYLKTSRGRDIDQVAGIDDQTLLHLACYQGHEDIVDLLITKYKAHVNKADRNGWTPLHYACAAVDGVDIAEILLKKGSYAAALTCDLSSPLHYLVCNEVTHPAAFHRLLALFLSKHALVDLRDNNGDTPLHKASIRGRSQTVLFLLNSNANIDIKNKKGATALHLAVMARQLDCVKILVTLGAKPSEEYEGLDCLALAQKFSSAEIEEVLHSGNEGAAQRKLSQICQKTIAFLLEHQSILTLSTDALMSFQGEDVVKKETRPLKVSSQSTPSLMTPKKISRWMNTRKNSKPVPFHQATPDNSNSTEDVEDPDTPSLQRELDIWRCKCGDSFTRMPTSFNARAPWYWNQLSKDEKLHRSRLSSDLCSIEQSMFFVRALLPIPINRQESSKVSKSVKITWGVWVSASQEDFQTLTKSWKRDNRQSLLPHFNGTLATKLPGYQDTLGLSIKVLIMSNENEQWLCPQGLLLPSNHQLAKDQVEGISVDRACELAHLVLHQPHNSA